MAGNKRWTEKDIATLRSEYGFTTVEELAKKLSRSVDAVRWKASKLRIEYNPSDSIKIHQRLTAIESLLHEILTNVRYNSGKSTPNNARNYQYCHIKKNNQ